MQEWLLLIQNNLYRLEVCHHAKTLRFLVSDKDHAYSEKIGEVQLMAGSLLSGERIEGELNSCRIADWNPWLIPLL